jgi:hypothetical protein
VGTNEMHDQALPSLMKKVVAEVRGSEALKPLPLRQASPR